MTIYSLERQMEQMKPLLANKKLHYYGKPIWRGTLFPSSCRMMLRFDVLNLPGKMPILKF